MYSNKKSRDDFLREIRSPLASFDSSNSKNEDSLQENENFEFDKDIMDALTRKFDELFGPIADD